MSKLALPCSHTVWNTVSQREPIGWNSTEQLALSVWLLNQIDLICTLIALSYGVSELNPLMQNTAVMVMFKVYVVGGLCLWLSRQPYKIVRFGLWLCVAVYAALAVWHGVGLILIQLWS